MIRKYAFAPILFATLLFAAMPAAAVTGGQEDGNNHPYGALLLVPGYTFCSGTLIGPNVVLTAGHCTSFWTEAGITEVKISFDAEAAVDPDTWGITGGTWFTASSWVTHPGYVELDWPFTFDYGLVFLDELVGDITPALLPAAWDVDQLIGERGQTDARFNDVGYGQSGVSFEYKPYFANFDFIRKYSVQRYNPSKGTVGKQDPKWLILTNVPSENFGGGCGGDSGSGIFSYTPEVFGTTVLAVHTGGYRMGFMNRLCGRITSLNHRVDIPAVLDWIYENTDSQ